MSDNCASVKSVGFVSVMQAAPWFTSLIVIERLILYKKKGVWLPVNESLASIATGIFQELAK